VTNRSDSSIRLGTLNLAQHRNQSESNLPLPRFCLTLPANPTPREIARLRAVARSLGDRIVCVIGPGPLGEIDAPCLSWAEFEQSQPAAFDAVISLAEAQTTYPPPEISAPLGTWAFFEGDPRYDGGAAGLSAGRPRVAMTLRRTGDGGSVLAFADAPRRAWDSLATLRQRLDAYLPQMIEEASERVAEPSSSKIEIRSSTQHDSKRRMEKPKDSKFLTHLLFNKAAPLFAKGRSIVLLLHNPPPDVLDSTLTIFRRIGPFIPYSRLVCDLIHGRPPTPGFALTFDDGYKENMALLDVLDRHECTAMFFLNTATIDEKLALWFMNPDKDFLAKKAYLQSLDYASYLAAVDKEGLTHPSPLRGRFGLRSEDVRTLRARGQEIGVHTHNHPFLTRLTDDEIRKEVSECWARLKSISGDPELPFHFAYPDGDHDERVVSVLAEMGAVSAVTTQPGPIDAKSHLLKIPRYPLGDDDYPGLALFKLTSAYPALQAARG